VKHKKKRERKKVRREKVTRPEKILAVLAVIIAAEIWVLAAVIRKSHMETATLIAQLIQEVEDKK
jgi:cell division protein FtsL